MSSIRKRYDAVFKLKVAIDAIKEELTQSQLSTKHSIHGSQINQWKKQALESIKEGFSNKRKRIDKSQEQREEKLFQQIGQLTCELAWLKKKSELYD